MESAREYAESVEAIFAETSALSARNVQELFIEISKYGKIYKFSFLKTPHEFIIAKLLINKLRP